MDIIETPSDEELARRLATGDEQALALFFDRHRARLWRMVNFRLNPRISSRVDPEDVLQEAWIDAQKRIDSWRADPSRSLFIWLRLVVGQTLTDVHKRHLNAKKRAAGREQPKGGIGPRGDSAVISAELIASFTSPSQAAIRAENFDQLARTLEGMDEIDREILSLRHFEELTNGETAELLGLKPAAASNRYFRALARIRALIEEESDGASG